MFVPSSLLLALSLSTTAPNPEGVPQTVPPADQEGPADRPDAGQEVEPSEPAAPSSAALKPTLRGDDDQPAVPSGTQISLADAVKLALEERPRLRSSQHDIEAERLTVEQAKAGFYPQIDGTMQYVRATENGNTVSFHSMRGLSRVGGSRRAGVRGFDSFNNFLVGVALEQQIWDFGRTRGAIEQRKAAVMAAEHAQVQNEQQIAFEVARAFYDVQAARESVDVAQDVHATAEYILELAEASQAAGLKPASESTRARANIATAQVRLVRAEGDVEAALARFAGTLGDARGRYEPSPAGGGPSALPSEDEAIAAALSNRPELAILDASRKGLDASMKQAKGRQLPRIDALAGVHSRGQLMPRPANEPTFVDLNVNIGVVVSVPIFQGFRVRKQKEELEARMAAISETKDEVSQAVIVEVRQAMANARAADRASVAAQSGAEAAEVALTTLSGRYSEGLARLVDLTDAQATYTASRMQLVDANFDRLVARAALRLAMGETPNSP